VSVDHYENFPVASVLCPPALRPAIRAIYSFARTADDLADEGHASADERLADLAQFRQDLVAACTGRAAGQRWRGVFEPLARCLREFDLPPALLYDLLDAFEQDVRNPPYADRAELLDYCRRSANPVGRLLLHLYGITDEAALRQSDAVCSALQLINFWQDLGVDGPRGRHYVPEADRVAHAVGADDLRQCVDSPQARRLVQSLCSWSLALMNEGAPLALRVPGRAGWELRLVVQGGLRILEKIERMDHATLKQRPKLMAMDAPLLVWRALRMGGHRA
jgi:squalene synthase HpnC